MELSNFALISVGFRFARFNSGVQNSVFFNQTKKPIPNASINQYGSPFNRKLRKNTIYNLSNWFSLMISRFRAIFEEPKWNKSLKKSNILDHTDESVPTEEHVPDVVASINAKIARYSQKIKFVHYEPVETDFYVFCNLSDSPSDRFQNHYTESEATYFGLVLKEIACSEDHRIRPIVCLNLTGEISGKAVSKVRAEELLEEWEKLGYFVQLDGMWNFGPRIVAEFDRYLSVHFEEEMHKCLLCKESTFYGVKCKHCPQTFHKECMKTYLRRLTNCPGCKEMWAVPV